MSGLVLMSTGVQFCSKTESGSVGMIWQDWFNMLSITLVKLLANGAAKSKWANSCVKRWLFHDIKAPGPQGYVHWLVTSCLAYTWLNNRLFTSYQLVNQYELVPWCSMAHLVLYPIAIQRCDLAQFFKKQNQVWGLHMVALFKVFSLSYTDTLGTFKASFSF